MDWIADMNGFMGDLWYLLKQILVLIWGNRYIILGVCGILYLGYKLSQIIYLLERINFHLVSILENIKLHLVSIDQNQ